MRYHAFISYASADRRIGERFQRAIEHYRLPAPLRGSDHGFGPVPKRLTPLFRDRSDASAGRDLGATLRTALEQSDALVVLCSPVSARSKWVNEEIRSFKRLGRNARIFPVLIDGTSRRHDPELAPDGAFPPALFERFGDDGNPLPGEDATPLAPDLRDQGDGWHYARLKVVAALTGIPLTLLTQRQQEAERREKLVVRWIAASMAGLALLASAAAVQAWRSAEAARARLADAIEMAARRVDDAVQYRDTHGVPTDVVRQLLSGAERDFNGLVAAREQSSPALELQRGRMSVLFSDMYGSLGDSERQLALARAGLATIEAVPTVRQLARPSTWLGRLPRPEAVAGERLNALQALGSALASDEAGFASAEDAYRRGLHLAEDAHASEYVARFWSLIGQHRYHGGDLQGALAAQDAAIAALDMLLAHGGERAGEIRTEQALARSDRAETLLELERHREALAQQGAAVAVFEADVAASPGDAAASQRLAQALVRQEDMRYAVSADWRPSLPVLARVVGLLERLHASDPSRIDYARDVSIALERLGDVHLQLGQPDAAGPLFERMLALRRAVLARDPLNPESRRDVAVALERQADLALLRGRPAEALAFLDEARGLRAGTGLGVDLVITRDMAVLWGKTGRARAASGGTQDWDTAFSTAIGLLGPLIGQEAAPPGLMRDLAVVRADYGDALSRSGRKADAIDQWRAAVQLVERQRSGNAGDPRLPNDLALLQHRLEHADQR